MNSLDYSRFSKIEDSDEELEEGSQGGAGGAAVSAAQRPTRGLDLRKSVSNFDTECVVDEPRDFVRSRELKRARRGLVGVEKTDPSWPTLRNWKLETSRSFRHFTKRK